MKDAKGTAAAVVMLLGVSWAGVAWAEDRAADAGAVFGAARVVDIGRLDGQRGGVDTSNRNAVNGTMHDTSATNVVTGSNTIADGSFAHSAGLPTVIQNSGANVLIQNATIVNVQFK